MRRSIGSAHRARWSAAGQAMAVARDESIGESAEGAEWLGRDEVPEKAPSDGRLASQNRRERKMAGELSSRTHQPSRCLNIFLSERVVIEVSPLPGRASWKFGENFTKSFDPESAERAISIEN